MTSGQNDFRFYAIALILLPVLIYFYFVWQFSSNIPSWDDFDYLKDIVDFKNSASIDEKFSILFGQLAESRIAFMRFMYLLYFHLTGEVNFKILTLLGNLSLLGLCFIIYKSTLKEIYFKELCAVPWVLVLFQLQNWNNMIWTAQALGHILVLLFCGACFYFLTKNTKWSFSFSLALALLASYTHGEGLFTFLLGGIYLLIFKRMKEGLIWWGLCAVVFISFFSNYEISSQGPGSMDVLNHPLQMAGHFLSFMGSAFVFKQFIPSLVLGGAVLIYFIYLTINKYYQRNPTLYLLMAFFIAFGLAASVTRAELGASHALTYRYKLQSCLLWITVYLSFFEILASKIEIKPKYIAACIFPAVIFYVLSALDAQPKLVFQKNMLTYRINHWALNNNGLFFHDQVEANQTMDSAIKLGIYHPPAHLLTLAQKERSQVINDPDICQSISDDKINVKLNGFALGAKPYLYRIEGMIYDLHEAEEAPLPVYVVLKSKNRQWVFSSRRQEKPELSIHFQKELKNTGIVSLISPEYFKGDPLQVGLCYENQVTFYDFQAKMSAL